MNFKEISVQDLNCGWCMGAGVVVGAGAAVGVGLLIVT